MWNSKLFFVMRMKEVFANLLEKNVFVVDMMVLMLYS